MTVHGIILAAGPGTRHRHLTNPHTNRYARPKAMLPIGNRMLIDFSIEALKSLGLREMHIGAGPRPLPKIMERHITSQYAPQIDIHMHTEEKLLDTAGTVNYLMQNFLDVQPDDTICVLPCDTPHNMDLNPILQAHLTKEAAVTMAALPIRWSSKEWERRTFGTIQMEAMPNIQDYENRDLFEEDVRQCARSIQRETFKVDGFYEQQEREHAQSNLINTAIYIFNAGFLMDLAPFITSKDAEHRFSDFGLHVFPLLAGKYEEFQQHAIETDFITKIKQGDYPFFAYLLPVDTYWRDVGNPLALLRVNMNVLDGKLDTRLSTQVWHQEEWGWQGNVGSFIDKKAKITPPLPGTIGSIIGSHVKIERGAKIERSIILDHNNVGGEIIDSIVFPGTPEKPGVIGKGVRLVNSIYVSGDLRYHDVPRTIRDRIVFELVDEQGKRSIGYAQL